MLAAAISARVSHTPSAWMLCFLNVTGSGFATGRCCCRGPVAQWIRHRPTEPGIAGSSPAGVIALLGHSNFQTGAARQTGINPFQAFLRRCLHRRTGSGLVGVPGALWPKASRQRYLGSTSCGTQKKSSAKSPEAWKKCARRGESYKQSVG